MNLALHYHKNTLWVLAIGLQQSILWFNFRKENTIVGMRPVLHSGWYQPWSVCTKRRLLSSQATIHGSDVEYYYWMQCQEETKKKALDTQAYSVSFYPATCYPEPHWAIYILSFCSRIRWKFVPLWLACGNDQQQSNHL